MLPTVMASVSVIERLPAPEIVASRELTAVASVAPVRVDTVKSPLAASDLPADTVSSFVGRGNERESMTFP